MYISEWSSYTGGSADVKWSKKDLLDRIEEGENLSETSANGLNFMHVACRQGQVLTVPRLYCLLLGLHLLPRLPEKSHFALRNSLLMSHVISIGLVRTCNLQVIASHRKNIFELNGNANSLTFVPIRNYLYCIF